MAAEIVFDWDEFNTSHIARHGVTSEEAQEVLRRDPITIGEVERNRERRWITVGEAGDGRVLVVVYTIRRRTIRVVTAYPANRTQKAIYQRHRR